MKAMTYAFLSFSGLFIFIRDLMLTTVGVDSWVLFLVGLYFLWRFNKEWALYKEYRKIIVEIRG